MKNIKNGNKKTCKDVFRCLVSVNMCIYGKDV